MNMLFFTTISYHQNLVLQVKLVLVHFKPTLDCHFSI